VMIFAEHVAAAGVAMALQQHATQPSVPPGEQFAHFPAMAIKPPGFPGFGTTSVARFVYGIDL